MSELKKSNFDKIKIIEKHEIVENAMNVKN